MPSELKFLQTIFKRQVGIKISTAVFRRHRLVLLLIVYELDHIGQKLVLKPKRLNLRTSKWDSVPACVSRTVRGIMRRRAPPKCGCIIRTQARWCWWQIEFSFLQCSVSCSVTPAGDTQRPKPCFTHLSSVTMGTACFLWRLDNVIFCAPFFLAAVPPSPHHVTHSCPQVCFSSPPHSRIPF